MMQKKKTKDTIVNHQADKLLTRNQIINLNWESLLQHTTSLTNTFIKAHQKEKWRLTFQEILRVLNYS